MSFAVAIAQIVGVAYIAMGIRGIMEPKAYAQMSKAITGNVGLSALSGLFGIIMGFIIVRNHNVWTQDWTVLVTIVGWIALIKGVSLLVMPTKLYSTFKGLRAGDMGKVAPIFVLIIGLIFAYFGFVA